MKRERMMKAPPNRTGPEIWRDMVAWNEQRRRLNGSGDRRFYDFVAYLKNHKPKDDKKKE